MASPVLIPQTYNPQTDGANSYATIAEFKAWHDNRLQDYSAYTDDQITAAMIAACDYIDARFSYIGWRCTKEQTTEFPRNDLWNSRGDLITGIPVHVKRAQYEYAIRWLRGGFTLIPDPTQDETGQTLKAHEVEAGPVRERKEYSAFSSYQLPSYPVPDGILRSQGFISNPTVNGITSRPTGLA